MRKDRDYFVRHGRAVFYSCMLNDFMSAAADCGWQLGLYGNFAVSLDMMAMPWNKIATPADELVQRICDCFDDNRVLRNHIQKTKCDCGRVEYLIPLWKNDAAIRISVMDNRMFRNDDF